MPQNRPTSDFISTIGFGFVTVSPDNRVPSPPARMTTFMRTSRSC